MPRIRSQELADLLGSHGAALVLFARQWCSDPDDALQEALIDLTKQASSPNDPVAWLYTTTKRRALNQTRSSIRRQRHQTASVDHSTTLPWFESNLEQQEEAYRLQQCLKQLDPLERQILVARIWGNLSFAQIANVVESSTSTVHRNYQTALHKMRNWLEHDDSPNSLVPPASKTQSYTEQ